MLPKTKLYFAFNARSREHSARAYYSVASRHYTIQFFTTVKVTFFSTNHIQITLSISTSFPLCEPLCLLLFPLCNIKAEGFNHNCKSKILFNPNQSYQIRVPIPNKKSCHFSTAGFSFSNFQIVKFSNHFYATTIFKNLTTIFLPLALVITT